MRRGWTRPWTLPAICAQAASTPKCRWRRARSPSSSNTPRAPASGSWCWPARTSWRAAWSRSRTWRASSSSRYRAMNWPAPCGWSWSRPGPWPDASAAPGPGACPCMPGHAGTCVGTGSRPAGAAPATIQASNPAPAPARAGHCGRQRVLDHGGPALFQCDNTLIHWQYWIGMKRRGDDNPSEERKLELLAQALAALREPGHVRAFLEDLCTPAELEAMSDRWRVVPLLEQGVPYREIHELTQVSVTTIGRVARTLERGTGGYALALRRRSRTASARNAS